MLAQNDLFVGTAWYPEVEPNQWCEAAEIRREDSCWPNIGLPETATRKQASTTYQALLLSLQKASIMQCCGSVWHVQSEAHRLKGAGRYSGRDPCLQEN